MKLPLIGPDQEFALWAVLIGLAGFGFWCERFAWGRRYSGVMLLMAAAILFANIKVIPTASPVYDSVWTNLVPVAIPLLLFQADLRRIVFEAGPTLIAFIIGSAAVVVGSLTGIWLLALGENEPELAGIFAGTYIGGSLNFAAVADASGMREGSVLAAAVAADNVVTSLHFLLILALPGLAWISRRYPNRHADPATRESREPASDDHQTTKVNPAGLLFALALAYVLAALGQSLAALAGRPQFAILVTTALALTVATFLPRPIQRLSGYNEAGNMLMFIFLASIGATADVWQLAAIGPVLFLFAVVIIAIHLLLLFGLGMAFKFDLAELATASVACVGGPASAAAIASAKGWRELMIPGVLAGSFGYAAGSFIGVSLVEWLR